LAEAFDLEPAMTAIKPSTPPAPREVERIQTGVRLKKRLLEVLTGVAEYLDLSSHRLRERDGGA